jgi:hypothetical protein
MPDGRGNKYTDGALYYAGVNYISQDFIDDVTSYAWPPGTVFQYAHDGTDTRRLYIWDQVGSGWSEDMTIVAKSAALGMNDVDRA